MAKLHEIDFIKNHIELYRRDPEKAHLWDSTAAGGSGVLPTLLLTTTGRKTGEPRQAPLIYGESGGSYVVIGSRGGTPTHPVWFLNLEADPKLAWALKHRDQFPVDVNRAPRELLLRIPGLGVKAIDRLIAARRHRRLRIDDLARLSSAAARALPFVVAADHRALGLDRLDLRNRLLRRPQQLDLFA